MILQHRTVEITNLKTTSANVSHRGVHWNVRANRAREHRSITLACWHQQIGTEWIELPTSITIMRISPGKLDDDNLSGGLKSIRDGITDCLGLAPADPPVKDDRDPRVVWAYEQASQGRGIYGVRITIQGLDLGADVASLPERQAMLTLRLRDQLRKAGQ